MGQVYVAEDTRLHRRVAIKLLPYLMPGDEELRRRFEREAQAIAALNHPGIVTIHGVEEADGQPFIVMELIEGQTLSDLLQRGRLPLETVLRIGIAVSDAIGVVHERGITHRDLKPRNVMLTADNRVKVLDFGLAKQIQAKVDVDAVTQLSPDNLTSDGRIIGTVPYMSPEQAQGLAVDGRSDIFSLGVMLYEMAAGDRPFKGDTNMSLISSILRDTPPSVTDLHPSLPGGLARIIRRALAKDRSRRYQTAFDFRNDLEELQNERAGGRTATPVSAPTPRWAVVLLGAIILGAVAIGLTRWTARSVTTPSGIFEIDRLTRLTAEGTSEIAAISPDGRYVVHTKFVGQQSELRIRQTATQSDVRIIDGAARRFTGLTFSPDGNYVYYASVEPGSNVGRLFRIPALGGSSQLVLEDIDSRASFSPDGTRLAFMRGDPTGGRTLLMGANSDGTDVRQIATTEPPDRFRASAPAWSQDGRTIVVAAQSLRDGPHNICFAVDVASGKRMPVGGRWANTTDIHWLPGTDSFIVVGTEFGGLTPQIWQVTLPDGTRRRVTHDLNTYSALSLSAKGDTIATVQADDGSNIWIVPIDTPDQMTQLTRGRNRRDGKLGLAWSSDGRIVFSSTVSGRLELWTMNADGSNLHQLTDTPASSFGPTLSPDNRYIVFQRYRTDGMDLIRINSDGSNVTPLTAGGANFEPVFSRDGQWIYFNSLETGVPRPFKISVNGGERTALGSGYFRPFEVSPDGRELLGVSLDTKNRRLDLATMPVSGGEPTLLGLGKTDGIWAPGGGIAYPDDRDGASNVWLRDAKGGKPRQLTRFIGGELGWFTWAPDGRRLAVSHGVGSSDVVLITRK